MKNERFRTVWGGDTLSHRKIKVTGLDGSYGAPAHVKNTLVGIDTVNGGTYCCSFLTKKNASSDNERYKVGFRFTRAIYNKCVKNGSPVSEDQRKVCNGAFKCYGAGMYTLLIHIWQKDVTIYETTDGTLPTPNNYFRKYTSADGEVKTYDWCDGKGGYQRIAAYKGNQLIYEMNQTVLAS